MMITPMPRVRPSTAVVWSPSPSRMPTCPVPSANSVGSDIQLRTTLAVPSVNSQPNPRPLAQPITAITATDNRGQRSAGQQEGLERAAPTAGQGHRDEAQRQQPRQLDL